MVLQVYIHFPFCKRKCLYCDFCSAAADEKTVAAYCRAMRGELLRLGKAYPDCEVSTVFLGGGTPTLVPPQEMAGVLDALRSAFSLRPDAEFTAEGNPGTLTREWLDMAAERGLNRLSLGVQAAQDALLRRIGRIHSFREAEAAVRLARAAGVRNLNLDAMFGLPEQTERDYLDTLDAFAALGAEHISAYSLILEEGTSLYAQVQAGQAVLPSEDETADMYEAGIARLNRLGYERYEVSNFARDGHVCRHNMGYWQGEWYLGVGVAAHSMLPPNEKQREQGAARVRIANGTDVSAYIRGENPCETELISPKEAMFESLMLGLRTTIGVSEERFLRQHGVSLRQHCGAKLDALAVEGFGDWRDGRFALNARGIEVENELLLRLMESENSPFMR